MFYIIYPNSVASISQKKQRNQRSETLNPKILNTIIGNKIHKQP